MTDRERLAGYVDVWWQAVNDFTGLLEQIPAEQWSTPTDLDGWDVHAVASHIAHLEGILAGGPEETVEVGEPQHVTGLMGLYTEQGVVSRRRQEPRPPHQRDPRGRHQAAHRAARRPAHRRHGQAGPDLRRHRLGLEHPAAQPPAGRVDARAGRTPRGPACPAAWTLRPRSTPPTTSPRASASCWRSGSAPPPAPPSCSRSPGSAPFAFTVNENGRGERLADVPADPTVSLADRPRVVHRARRRAAYPRARVGRCHRGHRSSDSRSSTPWRSPLDDEARSLVPLGHAGPGRAAPSWSPAPPGAASATTPRSSSSAAAAG